MRKQGLLKIAHAESARLYCLFALDAIFAPARLESFRAQPFLQCSGRQPEFPNPQFLGATRPHGRQKIMSSVKATQLRPGMVIQHEGQLFTIFSVDHRTPGNKRGSMQTRMKNLRTSAIIDYRFRAEEFVD